MAQFNFVADEIPTINTLYPTVVKDTENSLLTSGHLVFKNYDTYLQYILLNGFVKFSFDPLPTGNNQYLFLANIFKFCNIKIFTKNLNVLDSINLSVHQVEVTDIDAGIYTDLGVQIAGTVVPATAPAELISLGDVLLSSGGLLLDFTPVVYTGSLIFCVQFLQNNSQESIGTF